VHTYNITLYNVTFNNGEYQDTFTWNAQSTMPVNEDTILNEVCLEADIEDFVYYDIDAELAAA
jgi:hypothetical protein